MSLIQATRADVARFMRYVVVLPCGCWLWTGARSRGGNKQGQRVWYGSFGYRMRETGKYRTVRAHRFASEVLGKQPCPPGHDRDHKCELSLRVNPHCIEVVPKRVNHERRVDRRRTRDTTALDRALEMFDDHG